MGLLHHNLQRVKAGIYPLLPAGQIGPGEQLRFIQRVAEGAHLGDDGVEPEGLHIVEGLLDVLGKLLLPDTAVIAVQQHRLQVEVGQPDGAHLVRLLSALGGGLLLLGNDPHRRGQIPDGGGVFHHIILLNIDAVVHHPQLAL